MGANDKIIGEEVHELAVTLDRSCNGYLKKMEFESYLESVYP